MASLPWKSCPFYCQFLDEDVFIIFYSGPQSSRNCTIDSTLCVLKKLLQFRLTSGLLSCSQGILGQTDEPPAGSLPVAPQVDAHGCQQLVAVKPRASTTRLTWLAPPSLLTPRRVQHLLSLEQADWNFPLLPLVYKILFIKFQKEVDKLGKTLDSKFGSCVVEFLASKSRK